MKHKYERTKILKVNECDSCCGQKIICDNCKKIMDIEYQIVYCIEDGIIHYCSDCFKKIYGIYYEDKIKT